MRVLVDAGREEALEALAPLVEHADRRVARARQLARDLEQPLEHRLGVELGDQRPADVQQPPQAPLIHGFVFVEPLSPAVIGRQASAQARRPRVTRGQLRITTGRLGTFARWRARRSGGSIGCSPLTQERKS